MTVFTGKISYKNILNTDSFPNYPPSLSFSRCTEILYKLFQGAIFLESSIKSLPIFEPMTKMARIRRILYIKYSNAILPHKRFQMINLLESAHIDNFNAPPLATNIKSMVMSKYFIGKNCILKINNFRHRRYSTDDSLQSL